MQFQVDSCLGPSITVQLFSVHAIFSVLETVLGTTRGAIFFFTYSRLQDLGRSQIKFTLPSFSDLQSLWTLLCRVLCLCCAVTRDPPLFLEGPRVGNQVSILEIIAVCVSMVFLKGLVEHFLTLWHVQHRCTFFFMVHQHYFLKSRICFFNILKCAGGHHRQCNTDVFARTTLRYTHADWFLQVASTMFSQCQHLNIKLQGMPHTPEVAGDVVCVKPQTSYPRHTQTHNTDNTDTDRNTQTQTVGHAEDTDRTPTGHGRSTGHTNDFLSTLRRKTCHAQLTSRFLLATVA